eukprot:1185274-Prorocentrum_minimum.AAC.2
MKAVRHLREKVASARLQLCQRGARVRFLRDDAPPGDVTGGGGGGQVTPLRTRRRRRRLHLRGVIPLKVLLLLKPEEQRVVLQRGREVLLRVPLRGAYSQREPITSSEEVYTRGGNQLREARRAGGGTFGGVGPGRFLLAADVAGMPLMFEGLRGNPTAQTTAVRG